MTLALRRVQPQLLAKNPLDGSRMVIDIAIGQAMPFCERNHLSACGPCRNIHKMRAKCPSGHAARGQR